MELSKQQNSLQSIITEAWENESFKNDLIENPKKAIENLTGKTIDLPEGKTLQVIDQTNENVIYINIPAEPNLDNVELNEEQLEAVAGGNLPLINIGKLIEDILTTTSGEDGRAQ